MNRKNDPEDFDGEDLRADDKRILSLHHKWLKELFVAIRGNGDVKHGLEYKVQVLLDRQNMISKLVWIIAVAVVGRIVALPLWERIWSVIPKG